MQVDRAIQRVEYTDPDAARHRETVTEAQLAGCRRIAEGLATAGRLAEPWTADTATDMLWSLIAIDLFERLLPGRAWPTEKLEEHLWTLCEATSVAPARDERCLRRYRTCELRAPDAGGGRVTSCGPFGIPSTPHWTDAATIV
ncbi:MAG: hypothetical protein GEU97_10230 [Actinophytocola sp.]|nr:hypothetical protein [Actinophytocola sp.]